MMAMATANRNRDRSGVVAAAALLVLSLIFVPHGSARGDIITLTPCSAAAQIYQPQGYPDQYSFNSLGVPLGDFPIFSQTRYNTPAVPLEALEFPLPLALTVPNGAVIHSATFSLAIYGAFQGSYPNLVSWIDVGGFADDDGVIALSDLNRSASSIGSTGSIANFPSGNNDILFNINSTNFIRALSTAGTSYAGFSLTPSGSLWIRGHSLSLTIDYTPLIAVPEPSPLVLLTCAGVVGSAGLAYQNQTWKRIMNRLLAAWKAPGL